MPGETKVVRSGRDKGAERGSEGVLEERYLRMLYARAGKVVRQRSAPNM